MNEILLKALINVFIVTVLGGTPMTAEAEVIEPVEEQVEEAEEPDPEPAIEYQNVAVCGYSEFTTFMDYRANGTHTDQWQYQINAFTNDMGIRQTGDYIHVAVARHYNGVENEFMLGDKLIVNFGGHEQKVLVAEWKGNTTCLHEDGSMFELLVDTDALIRYNGGDNVAMFQEEVLSIKKEG